MKISLPINTTTLADHLRKELGLTPGVVMEAIPTLATEDGLFHLQIGNKTMVARLDSAPTLGQAIRVEVLNNDPVPTLRIVTGTPSPATQTAATLPPLPTNPAPTIAVTLPAPNVAPDRRIDPSLIQARVVSWEKPNRLILAVGNTITQASFATPLPPNTTLLLRPATIAPPRHNPPLQPEARTAVQPSTAAQHPIDTTTVTQQRAAQIFTGTTAPTPPPQASAIVPTESPAQPPSDLEVVLVDIVFPTPKSIATELRTLIPKQYTLGPALLLAELVQAHNNDLTPSPQLTDSLQKLLAAVPQLTQLATAPQQLREFVLNSGFFFEAHLGHAEDTESLVQQDLKAIITLLNTQLASNLTTKETLPSYTAALPRPPPPLPEFPPAAQAPISTDMLTDAISSDLNHALLNALEHVSARIQSAQLGLALQPSGVPLWIIDIPFRAHQGIGNLQLRVSERSNTRSASATPASWEVVIAVDLPPLGPIEARLTIQHTTVYVSVTAANPETLIILQQHRPQLGKLLTDHGLQLAAFHLHTPVRKPPPPTHRGWIDEIT
jgi:hypothetical protein